MKNPERAKASQRYFKTGKGQYAQGDIFIGLTNPILRTISKRYIGLSYQEIQELLSSKIHEYRLIALLILVHKYKKQKRTGLRREKFTNFI